MQHPEFRRGARDTLGPVLGMAAWGLVTGVAMVKSGLSVGQALGLSFFVYAGSAQLASLPLLAAGAPLWVLLSTGFCVNLRFLIFSARWRPYFIHLPRWQRVGLLYFATDMAFVLFMRRFPQAEPTPQQPPYLPYLLGAMAVNWLAWQSASVLGILAAQHIPTAWGLGFAGVLALVGVSYSILHERRLWAVALVAAAVSLLTYELPLRLHIVAAIAAAGLFAWGLDRVRPRGGPATPEAP